MTDEQIQQIVERLNVVANPVNNIVEQLQTENAVLKKALEFACTALEGEEPFGDAEEYYEGFIEKAKESIEK